METKTEKEILDEVANFVNSLITKTETGKIGGECKRLEAIINDAQAELNRLKDKERDKIKLEISELRDKQSQLGREIDEKYRKLKEIV